MYAPWAAASASLPPDYCCDPFLRPERHCDTVPRPPVHLIGVLPHSVRFLVLPPSIEPCEGVVECDVAFCLGLVRGVGEGGVGFDECLFRCVESRVALFSV